MAVQISSQQREQFLIALIHVFPSALFFCFNTRGHKKGRKGYKVEPLAPGKVETSVRKGLTMKPRVP